MWTLGAGAVGGAAASAAVRVQSAVCALKPVCWCRCRVPLQGATAGYRCMALLSECRVPLVWNLGAAAARGSLRDVYGSAGGYVASKKENVWLLPKNIFCYRQNGFESLR